MEGVRIPVRGALVDALVRPGAVVVLLILGQDGAQVCLADDQHPVPGVRGAVCR